MRNILATIAVLLSVCANAQYKEMLHAYITPTNKVVTSVPDWVKGAADYYYTFGFRKDGSIDGFLSFAHGTNVTASGNYSFASGLTTVSSAESSHAEGNSTTASGFASHAEGCTTVAKGNCSHAEGRYTTANGTYSHSSGVSSIASNNYSYVWSGVLPPANPNDQNNKYGSNGDGTFNVNPIGGVNGFYIGNSNLKDIIQKDSGMKLNMIVPITNSLNVVFNPIDCAANYVYGNVDVRSKITGRSFSTDYECETFYLHYLFNEETGEETIATSDTVFSCKINNENSVLESIYQHPEFNDIAVCEIVTTVDIPAKITGDNINVFNDVKIPKDTRLKYTFYKADLEIDGDCTDLSSCSFSVSSASPDPEDAFVNIPDRLWIDGRDYDLDYYEIIRSVFTHQVIRQNITAAVDIPTSTVTNKARSFTIAVETDLDTEKVVEWSGGEIIESFPGASKLVPGYVVWNVNEVAPGKFLVNRAPMNISSSSSDVTIKGDNGNDYTLNIDENGVLEVRNK